MSMTGYRRAPVIGDPSHPDLLFRSRLIGSNAPYVRMPELMPTTPIRTRAFPKAEADFPV